MLLISISYTWHLLGALRVLLRKYIDMGNYVAKIQFHRALQMRPQCGHEALTVGEGE